jgi:drug/metabolite transporter (DMT)-like permease
MNSIALILVLATNLCYAASSVFFKLAANQMGQAQISFSLLPGLIMRFVTSAYFWYGISAATAGTVCYIYLLSRYNLSYIYPLLSIAYIFVAFAGVFFLKETLSIYAWIGIGAICLGVAMISIK